MSVECDRAALWSDESRWSGCRPWAVRVAFTAASRFDTELELLRAANAAGAAKSTKLAAKSTKK
jgi:hypothetical protein